MVIKIRKIRFFTSLIGVFFFSITYLKGQINLRFPAERSVFQRNNSNIGNILITGTLSIDADRIEARLVPRIDGQGTLTNWTTIDNTVDGQSFTGSIEGKGGWYTLEVRSIKEEEITAVTNILRVGIGEVFVISGQSNAQGDGAKANPNGAIDDRVIGYDQNYYDHNTSLFNSFPEVMPMNQFSKIEKSLNIGPIGYSAWCYGELGDLLVKKLNVPVLFFNTALSGTSSNNWIQSITGQDIFHRIIGVKFEKFMPYHALRRTLQNEISLYGIRAILWHQGEFDFDTPEQTYINNINRIIQEVKNNTGEKIPWMIARASRLYGVNYPVVISAQNKIINPLEMIFPGPLTDQIQPNRPDGAHFENNNSISGLTLLAEEWNLSLNNGFFTDSNPIMPKFINEILYSCVNQSTVNLRLGKSFTTYSWSNNSNSATLQTNTGDITVLARDNFGNYFQSSRLIINNVFPKDLPTISPVISLTACVGKNLELQASKSKYEVNWNNGAIGQKLTVSQASPYFANFRSVQGCLSARSNTLTPRFVSPPAKPVIEVLKSDGYICAGEVLELNVPNPENFEVLWNNGLTSNQIKISQNTSIPLKVTLYSNFDCPSEPSETPPTFILDVPKTPDIIQSGPFSLQANSIDKPNKFQWFFENKIIPNSSEKDLIAPNDGFYSVLAIKKISTPQGRILECKSGISTLLSYKKNPVDFGISVYPNPITDNKFYLASDREIKNLKLKVINSIGQIVQELTVPNLLYPFEFNFSKRKLDGMYFLNLNYSGLSRTFPLIFE